MSQRLELSLVGHIQLLETLALLDAGVQRNIFRQALLGGAQPVLRQAQANAPKRTGQLQQSLKIRRGASRRGQIAVTVATRSGWFRGKQFYGGFVHFGHLQGSRELGASRKQIPGRPFVSNAWDQTRYEALDKVENNLEVLVQRQAELRRAYLA